MDFADDSRKSAMLFWRIRYANLRNLTGNLTENLISESMNRGITVVHSAHATEQWNQRKWNKRMRTKHKLFTFETNNKILQNKIRIVGCFNLCSKLVFLFQNILMHVLFLFCSSFFFGVCSCKYYCDSVFVRFHFFFSTFV